MRVLKWCRIAGVVLTWVAATGWGAQDTTEKAVPREGGFLSRLLPLGWQKNPRLDLIVVGEVTEAGRVVGPPSAAQPCYYIAQTVGYHELGDALAGEKSPPIAELERVLQTTLTNNHFLPATTLHPPTELLIFHWGYLNILNEDLVGGPAQASDAGTGFSSSFKEGVASAGAGGATLDPQTADSLTNFTERLALVGGAKYVAEIRRAVDVGIAQSRVQAMSASATSADGEVAAAAANAVANFMRQDEKTQAILEAANQNRYFVIVTAYDYEAIKRHEKKLLWITKMSTNSQGVTQRTSMPTLIVAGGPVFGRQTDGPIYAAPPMVREGRVEVGTPTIVPEQVRPNAPSVK